MEMEASPSFSRLIESIYDASLDAALWPEALEKVCAFVQGHSALIFYQSFVSTSPNLFHSWGVDLSYHQLFLDKYAKLDPLLPSTLFFEIGKVYALDDAMPIEEFRATPLYKEWVRPQGVLDALQTNLERTATGAAAIVVRRLESDGLFEADAKSRFASVIPHVRRAIAIGKVVDFHKANERALSETLDGLESAVLLVAQDGRLVHFNQMGDTMLAAANILRSLHGRLTAVDPRANIELQEAIAGATRGDTKIGVKAVAISLASDGRTSQVAYVMSLASQTRRDLFLNQAAVAVFVRQTTAAAQAPLEIMAQLYDLTAAEIRVLAALAACTGVADMARMLGIKESTVKSHLQRLFTKTGARRQAELIKLLASHGNTLGR